MTDEPSLAPIVGPDKDSRNINLIYILYLVGMVVGITAIIGVVMAYINRDDGPEWVKSHYRHQIHMFWKSIVYFLVVSLLTVVTFGILSILYLVLAVWFIIRCVKGIRFTGRGEPYPNPTGWGF